MSDSDESGPPAAKRPHARGIFERPTGSGIWWTRYNDEHGREHREKVGPKALALKVYQKRKNEIQERRFFPERIRRREVLLADAISDYLARVRGRIETYRDWSRYARYWTEAPETKGKSLRQAVPGDVERYIARRRADGMSEASCNRELTFLRCVYRRAIKDGVAASSPVLPEHFFKEANQRVRYLTEDEESTLRREIGERDWPKVAVALHTGFRQANEFRLPWTDVNFAQGFVTAHHTKSREDYHVPMNDELRVVLRALPSRLTSSWVFPSETGETPLDPKNFINRVFSPALERAGIRDFRWHDLRHTFASRLVMRGVDIRTVQELLGHKTLAMTQRYSHLSPAHKLDAVQRLTGAVAGRATGTTTGTSDNERKTAMGGSRQVPELPPKSSEPYWDRTSDPLLKRQLLYRLS
jgi:site-specific recombinase XerD